MIFARGASRSGLPGTLVDGDIRDRAAVERAAAGCDAISHSAALVSIWRRRRARTSTTSTSADCRTCWPRQRRISIDRVLYTSSFVAMPPRGRTEPLLANDYQRTKVAADRARRRSGARRQPADARLPRRRLRSGDVHGGQSGRPSDRRSSEATSCPGSSVPSIRGRTPMWTMSRRDIAPRSSAGASGGTLRARRRERAAAARLRDRAADHRTAAAAADSVSGRRRCSAPPRNCA